MTSLTGQSTMPLQREKTDKKRLTFGQRIGGKTQPPIKNPDIYVGGNPPPAKPKPFVPFGGDPKKDRPTPQESRDEINNIRKNVPDEPRSGGNWMNTPKVAKRAKDWI